LGNDKLQTGCLSYTEILKIFSQSQISFSFSNYKKSNHLHLTIMNKTSLFIAFLVLLFSACGPASELARDGEVRVEGTVQTAEGEPLPGIRIVSGEHQAETDAEGRFAMDGVQPGEMIISLEGELGIGQYSVYFEHSVESLVLEYPVISTVVFLHDNDLHFNFNHKNEFIAEIEEIRERYENVWLMNAGDTFVRHADRWEVDDTSYYADQSRFMIETMNEAGYDLGVPGNHELDYAGTHTGESLNTADFPLIAANIDVATSVLPQFKPFTILETHNGLSVAVLGLSNVNFDKPGVSQRGYAETIEAYENLADENELFMVLSHIGLSEDMALAEVFPELDLIIGGHSHTLLETAEMVNGVLIAQAGGPPPLHQIDPNWPKYLGKVKVVFENDVIIEKSGRVITIGEPAGLD
jgi:hypothetical protein